MEKGRSNQIIDRLVDMVENGKRAPFSSSKVVVDRDEMVRLLREMENIVNGELKIYRELNDKRGRIISEAKNEAKDIIYEARETASRIRVSKRMPSVVGYREDKLDAEEKDILRTANDIYAASLIYTDEMLTEANDIIAEAYDLIRNQYGKMVLALEEKAKLISDNKAELMSNLKELSKEERYEQILELGRLLSSELYYEKERAKSKHVKTKHIRINSDGQYVNDEKVNTGKINEADKQIDEKNPVNKNVDDNIDDNVDVVDIDKKEEMTENAEI